MLLSVDGAGKVRHVNVTAFALHLDVLGVCGEEASARVEKGPEGFLRIKGGSSRRGSEHLKLCPQTSARARGGERVRPKDQLSKL